MGLFSREKEDDIDSEDKFDTVELPKKEDFDSSFFEEDTQKNEKASSTARKGNARFTIDQAIELMRKLPKDNTNSALVITVVNKTLESMNIAVEDIITDAKNKEERIRQEHTALEEEVKGLQEKIAERKLKMQNLQEDLKETTEVKKHLQVAVEREKKMQLSAEPAEKHVKADSSITTKKVTANTVDE